MKSKFFIISILSLLTVLAAAAQKKPVGAAQTYAAAEKKCDAAITARNWKSAESSCKSALVIAEKSTDRNIKIQAYENYGFALFSQEKFQEALDNFTKGFEIAGQFLTESDAGLGKAYFNVGRANQGLAELDKAVENYKKAEQIYRAALEKASDSAQKAQHRASIRRALLLQSYIAQITNNNSEYERIEKEISEIDKQTN